MPTPTATEDGRNYILGAAGGGAVTSLLSLPWPPREGDAAYYDGVRVGTFHGIWGEPGGWSVGLVPTAEMPARLAERVKAARSD